MRDHQIMSQRAKMFSCLAVCLWVCLMPATATRGSVETQDVSKELAYSEEPDALTGVKRINLFLVGGERYQMRVLQDALAIQLRDLGWDVVSRFDLERKVSEDWKNWLLEQESAGIDSVQLGIPREMDDFAVAELVDADAYLVGTVLFGHHQYTSISKTNNASSDKIVITCISFQIISVVEQKTVLEAVIGYINGKSAPYVSQDIRLLIKRYLEKAKGTP